ncbi:MAG: hypothetical protein DRP30_01985 [Thermotoga sp.]|nr:MAG: hypothetical protein DRP30_01985 [Thermotoga sp.]
MRNILFPFIPLVMLSIVILSGCDIFGGGGSSKNVTVSIFIKSVAVPDDLHNPDGTWAKIQFHILKLKVFDTVRSLDTDYDSSTDYSDVFDSFTLSKGSKNATVELELSPKATVSIYNGMLFMESKGMTLESTKLIANFVRFSGDSLVNYDDVYISSNENIWILIGLDEIEDLYSSPTGNLNMMVLRESDLINVTGHIDGEERYLVKFESGYYRTFSTFTKDGDFSMKLPKGDYGVTVDIYEVGSTEPATTDEIRPTEDVELFYDLSQ